MKAFSLLTGAVAVLIASAPRPSTATEPRHDSATGTASAPAALSTTRPPLDGSTPGVKVAPVPFQHDVAPFRAGADDAAVAELAAAHASTDRGHDAPAPARTALWTSLAATGALTSATMTFGLLTRRASAVLSDRLARFPAPRASVQEGRARVRNFALLTDGFGLAAATALGVSTYFYFSTGQLSGDDASTSGLRAQIGPRASSLTWVADF